MSINFEPYSPTTIFGVAGLALGYLYFHLRNRLNNRLKVIRNLRDEDKIKAIEAQLNGIGAYIDTYHMSVAEKYALLAKSLSIKNRKLFIVAFVIITIISISAFIAERYIDKAFQPSNAQNIQVNFGKESNGIGNKIATNDTIYIAENENCPILVLLGLKIAMQGLYKKQSLQIRDSCEKLFGLCEQVLKNKNLYANNREIIFDLINSISQLKDQKLPYSVNYTGQSASQLKDENLYNTDHTEQPEIRGGRTIVTCIGNNFNTLTGVSHYDCLYSEGEYKTVVCDLTNNGRPPAVGTVLAVYP